MPWMASSPMLSSPPAAGPPQLTEGQSAGPEAAHAGGLAFHFPGSGQFRGTRLPPLPRTPAPLQTKEKCKAGGKCDVETLACDLADPKAVQVSRRRRWNPGYGGAHRVDLPPLQRRLPAPALTHWQALGDRLAGMGVTCLVANAGVFYGGEDDPLKGGQGAAAKHCNPAAAARLQASCAPTLRPCGAPCTCPIAGAPPLPAAPTLPTRCRQPR